MVNTPQRKRQRLNTRSSNPSSSSNSMNQGSSSRFEHAAQLHHPPPPHRFARKRNRALRNGNTDNDDSREMYEGIFDTGMRRGINAKPKMSIQMEFEVSSVRGEMVGPHYERKESTWLQLPEPSRAMSRLESSMYDQFIKKIPQDSQRTYDPILQVPISDTVPSDLREWMGTSSLDRSRTVTCSRLGNSGPSSHNHHDERMAHDEIDLGNGNGNFSEYEIEIRPSAKGAGDGDGDGVEWGEGEQESGTVDKGDRDQVERKDKKDKKEKEERVRKKPKGKEALREYNNHVAISQRETQNLLDSYVGFLLQQHEKFRLSFWPKYVPHKCKTCDIAAKELGPFQDGILSRKEFAILQDGRKRKRTKEMMDKLKDLVEWHKSNFEGDGSDP